MVKFVRRKEENPLSGRVEAFYREEGSDPSRGIPFTITADFEGIHFMGNSSKFSTQEDFEALGQAIGEAAGDHIALKHELQERLIHG